MYVKLTAPKIFDGTQFLPPGMVLIAQPDGKLIDITTHDNAGDGVEKHEGILCPGFINAHCHIELSHLQGRIPKGTGLVDFVQQVLQHRNEQATDACMQQEIENMWRSGIVAVGDVCNTSHSIAAKQQSRIWCRNFIEASGVLPAGAEARFQGMLGVRDQFYLHELSSSCIVPHSAYSVSGKLFSLIDACTAGEIITIHNQEAEAENEWYQARSGKMQELYDHLGINLEKEDATGKSSLQYWLPMFKHRQKIIAVHNTFMNEADLDFARNYLQQGLIESLCFCICINANIYIENALPPLEMMMQSGFPLVLGTDSLASNDQLSIPAEINTIQQNFPGIPLQTILQWATSNGATALGVGDKFGSLVKGKTPGVVQLGDNFDATLILPAS